MDIRSPLPPDDDGGHRGNHDRAAQEPGADANDGGGAPGAPVEPVEPVERVERASFRVATGVIAAKFAVAGLLVLGAVLAAERAQVVVALVAAVAVTAYAVRDLVARERLRADSTGVVVVSGYAGRRQLAWDQIERVRVDSRTRAGLRSSTLEIDADAEIFLLSRYDLGVEPDEARETLDKIRAGEPS